MAQETLPAPDVEAVEGEVITPEEAAEVAAKQAELAELEAVADQGIEALNVAITAGSVAANMAGLAIRRIQVRGLWKVATDSEGAAFTNFGKYAAERFGWTKTYGRLSQVTTKAVEDAYGNGDLTEDEYLLLAPKASGSSSGVKAISPEAALRVTLNSLETQQDKLATRMDSEPVKADKTLMKVLRKVNNQLAASITDLSALYDERNPADDDADGDDADTDDDEA